MGQAARIFAETNRVDEPFTAVLDSEAYRRQLRKRKRAQEKPDSKVASQSKPFAVALPPEAANQQFGVARTAPVAQMAGAA